MSHSIKRGVKACSNHTGPQREQKDIRRAWPSTVIGTAKSDGKGWYEPSPEQARVLGQINRQGIFSRIKDAIAGVINR